MEQNNLLIVVITIQTTPKLHLQALCMWIILSVKLRKQTKLNIDYFKEANVNVRLDGMGHNKICNRLNCVEKTNKYNMHFVDVHIAILE